MKSKKIGFFLVFVTGIIFAATSQGFAQNSASYPDKPITIVVPYPPGGFNDTLGRNSVMPGV